MSGSLLGSPRLPACGETGPSCFRPLPDDSEADVGPFPSTATADEKLRKEKAQRPAPSSATSAASNFPPRPVSVTTTETGAARTGAPDLQRRNGSSCWAGQTSRNARPRRMAVGARQPSCTGGQDKKQQGRILLSARGRRRRRHLQSPRRPR